MTPLPENALVTDAPAQGLVEACDRVAAAAEHTTLLAEFSDVVKGRGRGAQ